MNRSKRHKKEDGEKLGTVSPFTKTDRTGNDKLIYLTEIALQNEEQNNREMKLKKQLRLEGVRFEKESQLCSQEEKRS